MTIKTRKTWTTKEVKYLLDNSGKIDVLTASEYLVRSDKSVREKGRDLGVKFVLRTRLIDYAYYYKDELITIGTIDEISEYTGIPEKQLLTYRYKSIQKNYRRAMVELVEDDELLFGSWLIWTNTLSKWNIMVYMNNGV